MKEIALNGYGPDLDPASTGFFIDPTLGVEMTRRGVRMQRTFTTVAGGTGSTVATDALISRTAAGALVAHVAGRSSGSARNLYFQNGVALSDANRAVAYSTAADQFSFAQWGNYTFATNYVDAIQVRDATTTNKFADSAATALPQTAKILVTWGPPTFSMLTALAYKTGGTFYPGGFWHTPTPTTDWTPDVATGAVNNQVLSEDGEFTAGCAFQDGILAFTDHSMFRGTWIGPGNATIVQWTRLANDIGCVGIYARTLCNGICYFLGPQGLHYYDGSYPKKLNVPIQQYLVDWVTANPTVAKYALVTSDPVTQQLRIALRGSSFNVSQVLSINLLNMKVAQQAMPGDPNAGLGIGGILDRSHWFACPFSAPTTIVLYKDGSVPLRLTAGSYFSLVAMGDFEKDSHVNRAYVRFARPALAPTTLTVTHVVTPDPNYFGVTTSSTQHAITASPWRADVAGSGKWHTMTVRMEVDGTANQDPEVLTVAVDDDQPRPAGKR